MRLLTGYLLLLHGAAALNVGPDYSHPIEGRMTFPVSISKLIVRPGCRPPLLTTSHFRPSRMAAMSLCILQQGTYLVPISLHSTNTEQPLDIAILGFPYDTSTSYRPGARFGPRGIRAGSAREKKGRSYNTVWGVDPYDEGLEIVILSCPTLIAQPT